MIFDTDIMIWFLRGDYEAAKAISSVPVERRFASIVTYLEMVQGVRNKEELKNLQTTIRGMNLAILPVTEEISLIARDYMENYILKSKLNVCDALIAATARQHLETLFTGNLKHFKVLDIPIQPFVKE